MMLENLRDVTAYNTAIASDNKIHDDAVARKFGFKGGLVPGVDVYAYMTHPPAQAWGEEWLRGGHLAARFILPVYDGETVQVASKLNQDGTEMEIEVRRGETVLAQGVARQNSRNISAPVMSAFTETAPPAAADRPPASPESLAVGGIMGTLREHLEPADMAPYRADVREDLAMYEGDRFAHPGFLLRRANTVLRDTVKLGPWIHVSSDVDHFALLPAGSDFQTRAVVVENFDKKGHLFVTLDVAVFGPGEQAIMRCRHVAIYTPRQMREDAA